MNPHYPAVSRRAAHACEYCRAPEAIFNFPFEVEHIVPLSQEGADDETNLALACRSGNLHKADHLTGLDESTRRTVRLFHPRRDRWEEHFRVERETGAIEGLTEVGRATVLRLQMNSLAQLAARRQWMRLGLFPQSLGLNAVILKFQAMALRLMLKQSRKVSGLMLITGRS